MKKIELDRRTANQLGLDLQEVRHITATFVQELAKALVDGGVGAEAQIDRFGTFHIGCRPGVNIAGRTCDKHVVFFRCAVAMRAAMQEKFGNPEGGNRGEARSGRRRRPRGTRETGSTGVSRVR